MTFDEFTKVFRGFQMGETIQRRRKGQAGINSWVDIPPESWYLANFDYRIKPQLKLISWAVDDWREFTDRKIVLDNHLYIVQSWNSGGIFWVKLEYGKEFGSTMYTTYQVLSDGKFQVSGDKPYGKIVENSNGN